jgi:hypothetical protein
VGYPARLGFNDFMLTQGLARKLLTHQPTAGADTLLMPGGQGYLDLGRTDSLWTHVFEGQEALVAKGPWIDRPSIGIPYLYVDLGMMLAEALRMTGRPERAGEVLTTTISVARATRLDAAMGIPLEQLEQLAPPAATGDTPGTAVPVRP